MITLMNKETGVTKECTTGYSWTTFFFGAIVPLVRGDLKWAIILFLLCCAVSFLTFFILFGLGGFLVGPVFAFFYNKIYIKDLMSHGFIPADDESYNWCVYNRVILGSPLQNQNNNNGSPAYKNNDLPMLNDKSDTNV